MSDLSHLEAHVADAPEPSSLETIMTYANQLIAERDKLAELEQKAKAKKKEVLKLEQDLLPNAMMELGLDEIKLKTGEKISIKEELSCSVKNYEMLYDFLEEQGDDALMKTSIALDKLPQNILNRILKDLKENYDIDGTSQLYIHPNTLKAYFRRLCGIGTDDPARVPLASIDEDMLSTYTYYKVAVKK